jgi:hypothetical protein
VLQQNELDAACFVCMLGGDDGQTLFMMVADWQGIEENGRTVPVPHRSGADSRGTRTGLWLALRTAVDRQVIRDWGRRHAGECPVPAPHPERTGHRVHPAGYSRVPALPPR